MFVGGEDVTRLLRNPEISSLSSRLAVHPAVREKVCGCLRELSGAGTCRHRRT